jgi:hypothetical protein
VRALVPGSSTHGRKKEIWRRFGTWLLLGLEFELAADIVQSVIAPSWVDIGQLGAIAVIRTFLNYFLEKDLEHAESGGELPGGSRTLAATTALILACGLGWRPAYARPSSPDLPGQAAATEAALVELRRQIEVMTAELSSLRAAIDELRAKTRRRRSRPASSRVSPASRRPCSACRSWPPTSQTAFRMPCPYQAPTWRSKWAGRRG